MTSPETLNELFLTAVERYSSKRAALRYKADGAWQDITHQELARRVKHTALGLLELGVRPGETIAILSSNRPEWAVADYACLTVRCPDVPIYPTLPASQVGYILRNANVVAVFVENDEQLAKVAEIQREAQGLRHVITFATTPPRDDVLTLQGLLMQGAASERQHGDYREKALAARPDDLATLIYTSGTTGDPKGVMLSHGNFTSNVLSALRVLPIGPDDACLSLLPLSHSFERMAGHYVMLHAGVTINYAESVDAVAANMTEVCPTVMLAVPRLYEKIYARVLENAVGGGSVKRRIFLWARRQAEAWADRVLAGEPVSPGLRIRKRIGDRLVFAKLKARTGGRIRFFVSGGAPLSPEVAKFFYAAGLPITEGYGLTETSPVIAVNPVERIRIGSVGPPIPGVEVRIAEDGEILVRGPNVMLGYYGKPDATDEAIDAAGWFHTGDIGELDDERYLRITDRKKDLIVTAGGKNIAPQPIENRVKGSKFIENVVMLGDQRPFPSMVIVPAADAVRSWAAQRNLLTDRYEDLLEHPDVQAKIEREVMLQLREMAGYETPKKFIFVPDDFTIEGGELTPTLKVKRRVIERKYREQIEQLYAESSKRE